MSNYTIFQTPEELGRLARTGRESRNLALRAAAPQANVGTRFLSEFERGKPTAEFAKVISAVHTAGFDLAVIKRTISEIAEPRTAYQSKLLDTEFPYDWSNSQMNESVFIRKILKAGRFNDVLKTVAHFGLDTVSNELNCLKEKPTRDKIISMLLRIQKGLLLARSQSHDTAT